jgi:uncharacterized membrane protein (DUF485 family)
MKFSLQIALKSSHFSINKQKHKFANILKIFVSLIRGLPRLCLEMRSVRAWSAHVCRMRPCFDDTHPDARSNYPKETHMTDPVVDKIQKNPKYLELRRKRSSFGWLLTLLMMVVYYGYIALIAFNKPFLAQPIGAGVTTLGIPIGMGVIVFTVLITGIYVRRANSEFDELTTEILKDAAK